MKFFISSWLHASTLPSNGNAVLLTEILDQFIRTETLMTFLTIHQRIGETTQMSAGHPGLGIHQDRTVHTYIIGALLNELLPPCLFHIVLQFYTKITVIPGICQASVESRNRDIQNLLPSPGLRSSPLFFPCQYQTFLALYLYCCKAYFFISIVTTPSDWEASTYPSSPMTTPSLIYSTG